MALSREEVLACLKGITAPSGVDLVEAGLVRALNVDGDTVRFVMEVDKPEPFLPAKAEAEQKLTALGAASVSIVMTAHSKKAPPPDLKPNRKPEPAGPKRYRALTGSSLWRLARAALASPLLRPI